MYLIFVFYIADDGHMVGRNMWDLTVCIKLILVYLYACFGATIFHTVRCTSVWSITSSPL
jgi:hypothetical protein